MKHSSRFFTVEASTNRGVIRVVIHAKSHDHAMANSRRLLQTMAAESDRTIKHVRVTAPSTALGA